MTDSNARRKGHRASGHLALSVEESHTLEEQRARLLKEIQPFCSRSLLDRFSVSHPRSLDILRAGGILPDTITVLRDPLTGEEAIEDFSNIGDHSLAVGHAASKICDALVSVGALTQSQGNQIVHRALIHDAGKGLEILTEQATNRLISDQASDTFEKVRILKDNLQSFQTQLENPGVEAGFENLKNFLEVNLAGKRALRRGLLEEKIVRVADDMTASVLPTSFTPAKSYFVSPRERVVLSQFHIRYPKLYRQGLGIKRGLDGSHMVELNNIHDHKPNTIVLGSYVSLQIFAAETICEELKSYLAPSEKTDATSFVRSLIAAA